MKEPMKLAPLLLAAVLVAACAAPRPAPRSDYRADSRKDRALELNKKKGATVAVIPLQNSTGLSQYDGLGSVLAEVITAKFSEVEGIRLVEREKLEALLEEMKLGASGAIDARTAARIGNLLGAQVITVGTFTKIGKAFRLSIRLIRTETGVIIRGVSKRAKNADRLDIVAEQAAAEIARSLR